MLTTSTSTILWVFGYGSLMWKPGFEHSGLEHGFVKGYSRKFWQGSVTHRGTATLPGRVATLVPDPEGVTWGVAFKLVGQEQIDNALNHLGARESKLGGYRSMTIPFYKKHDQEPFESVLTYYATRENSLYAGPETIDTTAHAVTEAVGSSGHNLEYVTKIVDYVRRKIPEDTDEHLFELEKVINSMCLLRNISSDALIEKSRPKEDWTLKSAKLLSVSQPVRRNSWRA